MPPKAKFTKEEIAEAALRLVKEDGIDALTSRELGARLGSSARPIFTVFSSMEEVRQTVIRSAKALYREYVERGLAQELPFKGVGTQYILFAVDEPRLFQLLFMSERPQVPELSRVLPLIDESYAQILSSVRDNYGVDQPTAERLYRHLWIYTHGIATLCATGMCRFTGDEISGMISEVFLSLLKNARGCESRD